MDKFNKRKLEQVGEDDWEKAITNIRQTYINLETILESLKSSLITSDSTNTQLLKSLTMALLDCDLALLKTKNEIVQHFTKELNDYNVQIYGSKNNVSSLLKQTQHLLDQSKLHLLMDENIPLITESIHRDNYKNRLCSELEVNRLIKSHNKLEERYINAKLTIHGNREYCSVIENHIKRMNGLPRIIPLLNSSTKSNENDSKQLQQEKFALASVIESIINELAYLRLKFPLTASQQRIKYQLLQEHLIFLECIYNSLIRQMSYQQLLLDSFEIERKLYTNYKSHLQTYINKFEHEKEKCILTQLLKNTDLYKKNVDTSILRIKKYLKSSDIIKITRGLVNYDEKWKKQWSNDIYATLGAVRVLDQSKNILSSSLYHESITLMDRYITNYNPQLREESKILLIFQTQ
ncbi:unnamed protein product [Cunninghamella blakesleeana]